MSTLTPGGNVSYALVVNNAGPSQATGVSVTDTVPAGLSFVSAGGTGWACGQAAGLVTCTRATLALGPAPRPEPISVRPGVGWVKQVVRRVIDWELVPVVAHIEALQRAGGPRIRPIHSVRVGEREAWVFERVEPAP